MILIPVIAASFRWQIVACNHVSYLPPPPLPAVASQRAPEEHPLDDL